MKALRTPILVLMAGVVLGTGIARAAVTTTHPYRGVTYITRIETSPRNETMHILAIDLTAPGIRFAVSPARPPSPNAYGSETSVQTTLDCMRQARGQFAVNASFFGNPAKPDGGTCLTGFTASSGCVYSAFESRPELSYAITADAPALNIDANNVAQIVHRNAGDATGTTVAEAVRMYNAVSGSAQIITDGVVTIPTYRPTGSLTPNGKYSNSCSWYADAVEARTAVGLSRDGETLYLFTVDAAGGSQGMTVREMASFLHNEYGVYNALNLDGGGSTTMAMLDPTSKVGSVVNCSSNRGGPRSVGASLVVFASAAAEHETAAKPAFRHRCRKGRRSRAN